MRDSYHRIPEEAVMKRLYAAALALVALALAGAVVAEAQDKKVVCIW